MLKIAVLDSGIESCERGITVFEKENGELEFLNNSYDFDVLMHGDVVKQTIGETENAEVYSVKIFHNELYTTAKTLCGAIDWCINNNINIINISAGLQAKDNSEIDAIAQICKKAYNNNVVIVSSFDKEFCYPAVLSTVIGVRRNNDLLPGEYQIDDDGCFSANGEVEYTSRATKSRGGLNGSSFACARLTKVIINLLNGINQISYDIIISKLKDNIQFGVKSKIVQFKTGICGLVFLNNTNAHYLCNPNLLNYKIKTLYIVPSLYKEYKESEKYNVISCDLAEIFSSEKTIDLFQKVDTVVISNMDFIKDKIDSFNEKIIDLLLTLARNQKNVIYLGKLQNSLVEFLSVEFRKNKTFLYFTNEIKSVVDKDIDNERINKSLLLATSRIIDSILLECNIKSEVDKECILLSNNYNSQLIGFHTICDLYENQYYSFAIKKQFLESNIKAKMKPNSANHIYLSLNYPILQFKLDETRNERYNKFLSMVLAYDPDEVIIVANQQDDILDVISSINAIETITSKKVKTVFFSCVSYYDGDNYGYGKYAYLPSNRQQLAVKMADFKNLMPDVEVSELFEF